MAYEMQSLGARGLSSQSISTISHCPTDFPTLAFNHAPSSSTEAEYDRLRSLAHAELSKKASLAHEAHEAYERGDGARAHDLSEESKSHGAKADDYNRQASEYIFRANNANVPGDTIDLHGQYVEEAEQILGTRIRAAQSQGQGHLHVIVGKGNHSVDHVQKVKPAVEKLCQELGLRYRTEENEGRIYIDLQGGGGGYQEGPPPPLSGGFGPQYGQGYPGGGYGGGQQQQEEEDVVTGLFKCLKGCCTVM